MRQRLLHEGLSHLAPLENHDTGVFRYGLAEKVKPGYPVNP